MRIQVTLLLLILAPVTAGGQPKGNPAMPCFRALADDARFAALRGKVALGPDRDQLRSFTTSTERPTGTESDALGAWKGAREDCHQLELPYYASRDTEIQALARQHFAAVQSLIAELQSRRLAYGEFGRRRVELYEKVNRDIEAVRRRILPPEPVRQKPLPGN
jgi:hypothetical protein